MTWQDIDEEIEWLYKVQKEIREQEIFNMKKNVGKYCRDIWGYIGMISEVNDSGTVTYRCVRYGEDAYNDIRMKTEKRNISYDDITIISDEEFSRIINDWFEKLKIFVTTGEKVL